MNKRIQELAEQARKYADDTEQHWKSGPSWVSLFEAKFAELIAQDIASLIESQDVDPAFKHRISWAVKDRYGVK